VRAKTQTIESMTGKPYKEDQAYFVDSATIQIEFTVRKPLTS